MRPVSLFHDRFNDVNKRTSGFKEVPSNALEVIDVDTIRIRVSCPLTRSLAHLPCDLLTWDYWNDGFREFEDGIKMPWFRKLAVFLFIKYSKNNQ